MAKREKNQDNETNVTDKQQTKPTEMKATEDNIPQEEKSQVITETYQTKGNTHIQAHKDRINQLK